MLFTYEMNSIFGLFMAQKLHVNFARDLMCVHDSMNRSKIEFIANIYILLLISKYIYTF